jgi:nucleotide-binding universal stress UspA family protein
MKLFRKILFLADDTPAAAGLLDTVAEIAGYSQAQVTVGTVVETRNWISLSEKDKEALTELDAALVDARRPNLEELAEALRSKGIDVRVAVYSGDPTRAVVRAVLDEGFDLLVKAPAPERTSLACIFGSLDTRLLRACPCAVAVLRAMPRDERGSVVAAVDVDPVEPEVEGLNDRIVEAAYRLALAGYRDLHVIHAWNLAGEDTLRHSAFGRLPAAQVDALVARELDERQRRLDELRGRFLRKFGREVEDFLKPRTHLVHGFPRKAIPAQAKALGAGLLVMGTVARAGLPGLTIGNTAEAILNQVECSVLALKPEGFVSPIGPGG